MIGQVLAMWLAGYHLRRGVEEAGVELLIRSTSPMFKSQFESFTDWLTARSLDEQWPLDERDLARVQESDSYRELGEKLVEARTPKWLLGFRDITNATNERTALFSVLPP